MTIWLEHTHTHKHTHTQSNQHINKQPIERTFINWVIQSLYIHIYIKYIHIKHTHMRMHNRTVWKLYMQPSNQASNILYYYVQNNNIDIKDVRFTNIVYIHIAARKKKLWYVLTL